MTLQGDTAGGLWNSEENRFSTQTLYSPTDMLSSRRHRHFQIHNEPKIVLHRHLCIGNSWRTCSTQKGNWIKKKTRMGCKTIQIMMKDPDGSHRVGGLWGHQEIRKLSDECDRRKM